MQKTTLLLLSLFTGFSGITQESSDQIWSNEKQIEKANVFQQTDDVTSSRRGQKEIPKVTEDSTELYAPIDGGVGALLVAGALYGRRRWKQAQNKNK